MLFLMTDLKEKHIINLFILFKTTITSKTRSEKKFKEHIQFRKKVFRLNQTPYITKPLRKTIMERLKLKTKLLKNGTIQHVKAIKRKKSL